MPKPNKSVKFRNAGTARFVCNGRIDAFLKATPAIVAFCLVSTDSRAATLLSSDQLGGVAGSVPSAPPAMVDNGGGRIVSATQPLGAGSVSAGAPASTAANVSQSSGYSGRSSDNQESTRRVRESGGGGGGRTQTRSRANHEDQESREPRGGGRVGSQTAEAPASEGKTEVTVTTARSPWSAQFGAGYYTAYQSFRGVNILDSASADKGGGVVTGSAKVGYARTNDAFTIGFNYWQALTRQTPEGGQFNVPPNSNRKTQQNFSLPSKDRYAEYNLNLAYTRNFFDGKVVGTLGYNHFHFSNKQYYDSDQSPIGYANEITLGFAYTPIPHIQPSIFWAHDFDGFKGDYVELRVDGAYQLPAIRGFSVGLRPYAALSYDFKYNGSDNGWNAFEVGLSVPVRVTSFLTVSPTVNYVLALEDSNGGPRASDGLWGGIRVTVDWAGDPPKPALPGSSAKEAKIVLAEPGEHPWEISVGAGWRQVNYSFDHHSLSPFPTKSLFRASKNDGELGFATAGRVQTYDNGAIDARTPAVNPARNVAVPGTAAFSVDNQSQLFGSQVRFKSDRFSQAESHSAVNSNYDDQDSVVSPYIDMDREVWRSGQFSARVGLLYSFTASEGDSGYRLGRLDQLKQRTDTSGFVYSVDSFASNSSGAQVQNLVVSPSAYTSFFTTAGLTIQGDFTPQAESSSRVQEVVLVGTFVRSNLELYSHDLAIPLSARFDFGNRLHAEVTVAPTITFANAEISTDVESRAFSSLTTGKVGIQSQAVMRSAPTLSGPAGRSSPVPSSPNAPAPTSTSKPPSVATSPSPGGGKSAKPKSPDYPGTVVARSRFKESSTEVLFGVSLGGSLILDLNEDRTFYAEIWGRYHWVQDFSISNGFASSNVDLSSFQMGVGVGYRF